MRETRDLTVQAIRWCKKAVTAIEDILGPLSVENTILYCTGDGGFLFSIRRGIKPLYPRTKQGLYSINAKLRDVESNISQLIQNARNRKIPLKEVFKNPRSTAKKVGVRLSKKSFQFIKTLASSKIVEGRTPVEKEIIRFLRAVLADGRFVDSWYKEPHKVARLLKIELSEAAILTLASSIYGAAPGEYLLFYWIRASLRKAMEAMQMGEAVMQMQTPIPIPTAIPTPIQIRTPIRILILTRIPIQTPTPIRIPIRIQTPTQIRILTRIRT